MELYKTKLAMNIMIMADSQESAERFGFRVVHTAMNRLVFNRDDQIDMCDLNPKTHIHPGMFWRIKKRIRRTSPKRVLVMPKEPFPEGWDLDTFNAMIEDAWTLNLKVLASDPTVNGPAAE